MCFSSFWMGRAPRPRPNSLGLRCVLARRRTSSGGVIFSSFSTRAAWPWGRWVAAFNPLLMSSVVKNLPLANFFIGDFIHEINELGIQLLNTPLLIDDSQGVANQPTLLVSHHNRDTHRWQPVFSGMGKDHLHGSYDHVDWTPGRWPLQYCNGWVYV